MILVPPADAARMWPRIEGYVASAIAYSGGRYAPVDFLARILVGQAELLVSADLTLVGILEPQQFPRLRVLSFTLAGGEPNGGHSWDDLFGAVRDSAVRHGCSLIEIIGRPGWAKLAGPHGYTPTATVLAREV